MKWIRRVVTILFIVSTLIGSLYIYREKVHADHKEPEITCETLELTVDINAGKEELLKGVQATDDRDQDVTDSLLIENIKKKPDSEPNAFTIQYIAFDHSNNEARFNRTVFYNGYTPPHFAINQPLRFASNEKVNLLDHIQASDSIDGDISSSITIEGNERITNRPQAGIYDCTLKVTNRMGDTAVLPISVEIYEDNYVERSLRPEIVLKQQILYLPRGAAFEPNEYLDYINQNGVVQINQSGTEELSGRWVYASDISQISNVNTEEPGNYSVIYTYTGEDGAYQSSTQLLVVVE